MLKTQLTLAIAVVGSAVLLQAQGPPNLATRGRQFIVYSRTVVVSADEFQLINAATQERQLLGSIKIRPLRRPVTQTVAVTNAAGAPFPTPEPVRALVRGRLEIVIDNLLLRADEADIDTSTGDMELRGNVTLGPGNRNQ